MAPIHELCKETDPVLATTRRWVFLLSRSWGSAPDPEVCLKGCRGVWTERHSTHTPDPRVPCSRLGLLPSAQLKRKAATTNWTPTT